MNKDFGVLRKVQLCQIKGCKFVLHPKDFELILPVNKVEIVLSIFSKRWQASVSPLPSINLFENTKHRFLRHTIISSTRNANNLQSVLLGILGVSPALSFSFHKPLCRSVINSPNDRNICFQLFLNELQYP